MKLVQFGAGNIGRAFIGYLFSRAGWELVFIDTNPRLVELLNTYKCYTVVIKDEGREDRPIVVSPVRAVDGRDVQAVAGELIDADMLATSVGKKAFPHILPLISAGQVLRGKNNPGKPLDIIIAENARDAAAFFRDGLKKILPDYPLDQNIGLVETSIGKMVPLMKDQDRMFDPLQIFAEAYETLIVDKSAFRGPLPQIEGMCFVKDIKAFVDRKLFIHNLGHAAIAYLGYKKNPHLTLIADVMDIAEVVTLTMQAMQESAVALQACYPEAYSLIKLQGYIENLLQRFKNRALGDTVYRVGRDLYRKLDHEDRLVGSMRLCAQQKKPFGAIAKVYIAALDFTAVDEKLELFLEDSLFHVNERPQGFLHILLKVSHLNKEDPLDACLIEVLMAAYKE